MNIKKCILMCLSVLGLLQATQAQDWHQLELENTGTIEVPGKPIVYDTLGLHYYKIRNETLFGLIILGMSVQGDETVKRSSKEYLMQRMEFFLEEQQAQQIQQSDITVDGRPGMEAKYLVTLTNASNQSVLTNIRYIRLIDNDGRMIVLEMGMAAEYEKEIESIKDRFFNSLKLNEASVSDPPTAQVSSQQDADRKEFYTIWNTIGKIAIVVILIIVAILIVNRIKK